MHKRKKKKYVKTTKNHPSFDSDNVSLLYCTGNNMTKQVQGVYASTLCVSQKTKKRSEVLKETYNLRKFHKKKKPNPPHSRGGKRQIFPHSLKHYTRHPPFFLSTLLRFISTFLFSFFSFCFSNNGNTVLPAPIPSLRRSVHPFSFSLCWGLSRTTCGSITAGTPSPYRGCAARCGAVHP